MWVFDSSCITQQQNHSLLSVERCVTSRKTAAKETNRITECRGFESHLGLGFFRVSSGFYRNTISCNKYEERQKRLVSSGFYRYTISCNKYEERQKRLTSIFSLIFVLINLSRVIQAFLGKRDELERRYRLSSSYYSHQRF